MNCINVNSKEFKDLVKGINNQSDLAIEMKVAKWQEYNNLDRFPTLDEFFSFEKVNFDLKAVNILKSDKAKQIFEKGKKNKWDLNKILTELQIPKLQKQIILNKNINNREEIITFLLSENSFTVEINTAMQKSGYNTLKNKEIISKDEYDNLPYKEVELDSGEKFVYQKESPNGSKYIHDYNGYYKYEIKENEPSQYYSNLTVPGGTNYTENEIVTPAITPNIEGHAQFSTDNGIGWFRSDEQKEIPSEEVIQSIMSQMGGTRKMAIELMQEDFDSSTKTRRILEVQSDLFQKGRNERELTKVKVIVGNTGKLEFKKTQGNEFLQLLNNKNNWVTFFVNSIIQDSAKKGYEKVLFPKGDTAAKIEGHQTLEEFRKQKEARIKELEKLKEDNKTIKPPTNFDEYYKQLEEQGYDPRTHSTEEFDKVIQLKEEERVDGEIKQLKQELADVESGQTQLSSIANFYENTVTNILKKQGYNPVEITDEYGNKWNEISIEKDIPKEFYLNSIIDKSLGEQLKFKNKKRIEGYNTAKEIENLLTNKTNKFEYSASEMMTNVLNELNLNPTLTEFLKLLAKKTNATVIFGTINDVNVPMQYEANKNVIIIDRSKFKNQTVDEVLRHFNHELVHSVLIEAGRNNNLIDNQIFNRKVVKIFNEYKRLANKNNFGEEYGFKNVDEFMAEMLSNPDFRAILKTLDDVKTNSSKNLFERIIDAILTYLGVRPKSLDMNETKDFLVSLIEKSDYKGGISETLNISVEADEEFKRDLSTIEGKYKNLIDDINTSLDININNFERLVYNIRNFKNRDEDRKRLGDYIEQLEEIKKDINNYSTNEPARAILSFVENIKSETQKIKYGIENRIKYENLEEDARQYDILKSYHKTYELANDIKTLIDLIIRKDDGTSPISVADAEQLRKTINDLESEYNSNTTLLKETARDIAIKLFSDPLHNSEIINEHRERLKKEFKAMGLHKSNVSMEKWIADKIKNRDADKIQNDIDKNVADIFNNLQDDIYFSNIYASLPVNLSSDAINILNMVLKDIKNEQTRLDRAKEKEFDTLFKELKKDRGSGDLKKLYGNMLEQDSNGTYYFKGEYSIEFMNLYKKYTSKNKELYDKKDEIDLKLSDLPRNSEESRKLLIEKKKINKAIRKLKIDFESAHTKTVNGDKKPLDKYKNDLSNLSPVEKKVLKFIIEMTEHNNESFSKSNSNVKYLYKTRYYELPKVTKNDIERLWDADVKGIIKDKISDLTDIKSDDLGYIKELQHLKGEKIHKIKVPFRDTFGKFNNKDQSLDIFNIIRMDFQMANSYKVKQSKKPTINLLLDAIKSMQFKKREGTRFSVNSRSNKYTVVDGEVSNTYKYAMNLVEQRFYGELKKSNAKFSKLDANKLVSFANSTSAFLTLSMNIASGAANVLNAQAQMFLESFLKGLDFKASNIKKANAIYMANLGNSISDVINPINTSYVNQIYDIFDVKGNIFLNKGNFLQNNIFKKGLDIKSLQLVQDSTEHYISAIITMATLDNIKVMDKNHNYLTKDGEITLDLKKAASLLDMLKKDEKTDLVELDSKVVYTTHSRDVKWDEGGKVNVDLLIDKMLYNNIGAYKTTEQPEIMRHWYGNYFLLFRRYFITMSQSRWRGIETLFKGAHKLTKDEKRYSYALQDYDEGYYVSASRYTGMMFQFLRMKITGKQYELQSHAEIWDTLSDRQKHNIFKSIKELGLIISLAILAKMMVAKADKDDEELFFLAYLLRRLETEVSAYASLPEMFKMLRSPIPSMDILSTYFSILPQFLNPTEVYEKGIYAGENKLWSKIRRRMIIIKEFNKQYERMFNFQDRTGGGGLMQ